MIHSDVWGPSRVESFTRKKYFISFTNDYSCLTRVYFLHKKSEVFSMYKKFVAWLKVQFGAVTVKHFHCDRRGEYLSKEFGSYLESQGTEHKLMVHDMPEENGVSEHLNRVVLEKTRAMFHASGLPKFLWAEAVRHVIWLKNRSSTHAIPEGKTPYELVRNQKPNLSGLHKWGTICYMHQPMSKGQSKLDSCAKMVWWIGVDDESQGAQVYWPDERHVTVERGIVFQKLEVMVMIDGNTGDLEREQSVSTSSKPPNISSVPQAPPLTHVPLPPSPTLSSSSDPSSPTMSESSSKSTQPKAKVPTHVNPSQASR